MRQHSERSKTRKRISVDTCSMGNIARLHNTVIGHDLTSQVASLLGRLGRR